jgi:hypothetical protein
MGNVKRKCEESLVEKNEVCSTALSLKKIMFEIWIASGLTRLKTLI